MSKVKATKVQMRCNATLTDGSVFALIADSIQLAKIKLEKLEKNWTKIQFIDPVFNVILKEEINPKYEDKTEVSNKKTKDKS